MAMVKKIDGGKKEHAFSCDHFWISVISKQVMILENHCVLKAFCSLPALICAFFPPLLVSKLFIKHQTTLKCSSFFLQHLHSAPKVDYSVIILSLMAALSQHATFFLTLKRVVCFRRESWSNYFCHSEKTWKVHLEISLLTAKAITDSVCLCVFANVRVNEW